MFIKPHRVLALISLLLLVASTNSIAQNLHWVKEMGSNGWDEGRSIAVDGDHNVYSVGHFQGTVDFDPGVGVYNLTSVGEMDAVICKLDSEGDFLWAKQFGDSAFIEVNAMVLNDQDNICITGSFLGQIDFDPGADMFNLTSTNFDRDIFIQKLDLDGNLIWAKQISGFAPGLLSNPSPANAYAIDADAMGNLYLTGYFDGTVDFDPDTTTAFYLTVVEASDIFVNKLDSEGNFVWVKQLGGTSGAVGYAIAVDDNNHVYSSGTIGGTVDFDPGTDTYNIGISDPFLTQVYLSKLDAEGNFLWAKDLGPGEGLSIAVDENSNAYASGWFPTQETALLNKYDSSGEFVWAKELGGYNGNAITIDYSGNVYITGLCFGTQDFDPGPAVFNLEAGNNDTFISKLDANGGLMWAGLFMTDNQITTSAISVDSEGSIYTTGFFNGDTDFDPSELNFNLEIPLDGFSMFVHKLGLEELVSVKEKELEDQVSVFPNPTEGIVTAVFKKDSDLYTLTLRNTLGQVVESKIVSYMDRVQLEIPGPPALYLLEIKNQQKQSKVIKVVKK